MEILGVRLDNLSRKEILKKIAFFLEGKEICRIATINPEIALEALKNPVFRKNLNSCDLNLADGFGIKLAFWRKGKNLKCRFPGADLVPEILRLAEEKKLPVFLAVRSDGLSGFQEIKSAILEKHPKLSVDGKEFNLSEKFSLNSVLGKNCVLFCNFGAPFQEIFINSIKCDNIRLAMGVGGSFDFLTGRIKRAPVFMRRAGLEWLWRLIQQPNRWKRIWNAVAIFPVKVIFGK